MRWYAMLGAGHIECMTPDELAAAYDCGIVNDDTPVLKPHARQWVRLGYLAKLDEPTDPSTTPNIPRVLGAASPQRRLQATWAKRVALITAVGIGVAGYEAHHSGAFSEPTRSPQPAPPPPTVAKAATMPESTAVAGTGLGTPAPDARLPRADNTKNESPTTKRRTAPKAAPLLSPAQVGRTDPVEAETQPFSSHGNKYDPLNSDLP